MEARPTPHVPPGNADPSRAVPATVGSVGAPVWTVDLRQVIYALSDALDLVGIDDVGHGKRVGIMGAACGRSMALPDDEIRSLFDLGMLHDVGVSTTTTHGNLVREFDWEGAQLHCRIGHALLRDFPPLASHALPILYHHTRWDCLRSRDDVDVAVRARANLVFLVDRVDAMAAPHYADRSLLMRTASIRDEIRSRSGTYFSPELVDAFLTASAQEAFWLSLEPRGVQCAREDMLEQQAPCEATVAELRQLAEIFSRIVDAKSPFTAQHSAGVASLARHIAERMGVGPVNCDRLEIAGLLHDLGKLRIPDEILDKPGKLDDRERKIMNSHSFETYQILRHIHGFEEITRWASHHHEEPDGSGYPFHVRGSELPLEARILRVADIFQAMAQDRPYRKGLNAAEVLAFLEDMVRKGRVEPQIVSAVAADMPAAMAAALPVLPELHLQGS
jgi:putative nucleotidyltransferase with HDIG domain